jgi:hypothetical protein
MVLEGAELAAAKRIIKERHYLQSLPRGRVRWYGFDGVIVVFCWLPIFQMGLSRSIVGQPGMVIWDLARLWAPDGHAPNALTSAISQACKDVRRSEKVDLFVAYADPTVGHDGHVYRAASWVYDGEHGARWGYVNRWGENDEIVSAHKFRGLYAIDIWNRGYNKVRIPRKYRFIRLVSKRAKLLYRRKKG